MRWVPDEMVREGHQRNTLRIAAGGAQTKQRGAHRRRPRSPLAVCVCVCVCAPGQLGRGLRPMPAFSPHTCSDVFGGLMLGPGWERGESSYTGYAVIWVPAPAEVRGDRCLPSHCVAGCCASKLQVCSPREMLLSIAASTIGESTRPSGGTRPEQRSAATLCCRMRAREPGPCAEIVKIPGVLSLLSLFRLWRGAARQGVNVRSPWIRHDALSLSLPGCRQWAVAAFRLSSFWAVLP